MVQVEYLKETKTFSPQEISSMVLMKVRLPALNRDPFSNGSTDERGRRN